MTSSPNFVCGLRTAALSIEFPELIFTRQATMVVVPISTAMPRTSFFGENSRYFLNTSGSMAVLASTAWVIILCSKNLDSGGT